MFLTFIPFQIRKCDIIQCYMTFEKQQKFDALCFSKSYNMSNTPVLANKTSYKIK